MPSFTYTRTDRHHGPPPPPTTNELSLTTRVATLKSDRKASRLLGITIARAPHLLKDRKASQVLGTSVIRSDWDSFACDPNPSELLHGSDSYEKTSKKKSSSLSRAKWMRIGGVGGNVSTSQSPGVQETRNARRAQKVILAGNNPSPTQRGRRHTVSYDSGVELLLPHSNAKEWPNSPSSPGRHSEAGPESPDRESFVTPTSSSPFTPLNPDPVAQRRRQMIRSATKSMQILGDEASHAIMEMMEKENMGRIGWDM